MKKYIFDPGDEVRVKRDIGTTAKGTSDTFQKGEMLEVQSVRKSPATNTSHIVFVDGRKKTIIHKKTPTVELVNEALKRCFGKVEQTGEREDIAETMEELVMEDWEMTLEKYLKSKYPDKKHTKIIEELLADTKKSTGLIYPKEDYEDHEIAVDAHNHQGIVLGKNNEGLDKLGILAKSYPVVHERRLGRENKSSEGESKGKDVPKEVLADYPDLQEKESVTISESKEVWEMTKSEWNAAMEEARGSGIGEKWTKGTASNAVSSFERQQELRYNVKDQMREQIRRTQLDENHPDYLNLNKDELEDLHWDFNSKAQHIDVVRKALQENKPVPVEVLEEYPELQKKQEGEDIPETIEELVADGYTLITASEENKAKENWELSFDNWRDKNNVLAFSEGEMKSNSQAYQAMIRKAIFDGKPIPDEVFTAYTKLSEKPSTPSPVEENNTEPTTSQQIIQHLHTEYFAKEKRATPKKMLAIADKFGVKDRGYFYEVAELAWMLWYKRIIKECVAKPNQSIDDVLAKAWDFYWNVQPTFNQSGSEKRMFQQYSTPAPIGIVAAYYLYPEFLSQKPTDAQYFEPSAGNGLLVSGLPSKQVVVNELSKTRHNNLLSVTGEFAFKKVLHQDGTKEFADFWKTFDGVLTNPPFASQEYVEEDLFNGEVTKAKLEHLMTYRALETMKDNGRAAIIVGEWTEFNRTGKISVNRQFYRWLHRYYYVDDMININSRKLYNRQGTAHWVRLILIGGRKPEAFGKAPNRKEQPQLAERVDTIWQLLDRVKAAKIKADAGNRPTMEKMMLRDIAMMEQVLKG